MQVEICKPICASQNICGLKGACQNVQAEMYKLKYISLRYFLTKSKNPALNYMSMLAIAGVIVSSAAMMVVLSGFSGLKNYSLEFISSISPELKISSVTGKTFEFKDEMKSFLEKENIDYGLTIEDRALLSINENSRIVR